MSPLVFDVATMDAAGIEVSGGLRKSYEELGLAPGQKLRIFASVLTIKALPPDRDVEAFCEAAIGNGEMRVTGTAERPRPSVSVHAWGVQAPIVLVCAGQPGGKGETGATPPPIRPPEPEKEPGAPKPPRDAEEGQPGGRGGKGGTGGQGGIAFVVQSTGAPSQASAPGGAGGEGGDGGGGGMGFPRTPRHRGPKGPPGPRGDDGPPGDARTETLPEADFVRRFGAAAGADAAAWFKHLLAVAAYHHRRDNDASGRGRAALRTLTRLAADQEVVADARILLDRIRIGTTPTGMARGRDVTPDVAFAGKDNNALLEAVRSTLAAAGGQVAQWAGGKGTETLLDARLGELRNSVAVLEEKIRLAQEDVAIAGARRASALERVEEIKKDVEDLREAAEGSGVSFFGQITALVKVGVAAATGVGGVIAIGQGLIALEGAVGPADTLYDVVKGVMDRAGQGDKDAKGLIKGFNDIGDSGKKLLGIGAVLEDLDIIERQAPPGLSRQIASMGRELTLAAREAGIADMGAKRAQAAEEVASAELEACTADMALVQRALARIAADKARLEEYVRAFLSAARRSGDLLGDRLFFTMRAKEIYLGLDRLEPPSYDFGWVDPDREALAVRDPNLLLFEAQRSVVAKAPEVVEWSGVYREMFSVAGFSFSPTDASFASSDPAVLARLRRATSEFFALEFEVDHADDDIFELRFDTASVALPGARLKDAAGHPVRLQHTGVCSLRRCPRDGTALDGVKAMALRPQVVDLSCSASAAGVEGGMPPVSKPDSLPPISVWGRPVVGRWKIWVPDAAAAWDLSGLQSIAVTFHATALLRATGGNANAGPVRPGPADRASLGPPRRLAARPIRIVRLQVG